MSVRGSLVLLAALSLPGCKSYIRPFDDTSLPARSAVTVSGATLEAKDGALIARTGPGEIARQLGVELDEDEKGVIVSRVVRAGTPLKADDRIVYAEQSLADVASNKNLRDLEGVSLRAHLMKLAKDRAAMLERQGGLMIGKTKATPEETRAVLTLWAIATAENAYHENEKDTLILESRPNGGPVYASLATLERTGLVDTSLDAGDLAVACEVDQDHPDLFCTASASVKPRGEARSVRTFLTNQLGGVCSTLDKVTISVKGTTGAYTPEHWIGDPPTTVPAPEHIRARALGRPVQSIAELQRYGLGLLSVLTVIVERDGKELALECELKTESHNVPIVPYRVISKYTELSWEGVELARVDSLPEALRPAYARSSDLLVTRVAQGAPAAIAGLRPLDVIAEGDSYTLADLKVEVRSTSGTRKLESFDQRKTYEYWIPFVAVFEKDATRMHVGLGPLDAIFHYSRKLEWNVEADGYVETSRVSFGTTIAHTSKTDAFGSQSKTTLDVSDHARVEYFTDWNESK